LQELCCIWPYIWWVLGDLTSFVISFYRIFQNKHGKIIVPMPIYKKWSEFMLICMFFPSKKTQKLFQCHIDL
jgi:hypothetical protein